MPERIPDEKRQEIIRRMILVGNAAAVAREFGVAESSVRNLMAEVRAAKYPDYLPFLENLEGIRRLNGELNVAHITPQQAMDGLTIYKTLEELGIINSSELLNIVRMLKGVAGDKPPAGFGSAVAELTQLQAETGLTFHELTPFVKSRKQELGHLESEAKTKKDEVNSIEARKLQVTEELDRALKLKGTTIPLLNEYTDDKTTLDEAGIPLTDVKTLADFVRLAKSEGFLSAAKELHESESETGMSFMTIRSEYKQTQERLEKTRQGVKELDELINTKNQRIADLKREEAEQLSRNGVTKEKVERFLSLVDRLKKAGVDIED